MDVSIHRTCLYRRSNAKIIDNCERLSHHKTKNRLYKLLQIMKNILEHRRVQNRKPVRILLILYAKDGATNISVSHSNEECTNEFAITHRTDI